MNVLFIMDPVSTVIVNEDTTFALMEAAEKRGHDIYFAEHHDLALDRGALRVLARPAKTSRASNPPILLEAATELPGVTFGAIFVRKDPPFNDDYLWLSLLLEHLPASTQVVNRPQGLRDANEKLYACHFPEWMPQTLVSSNRTAIRTFIERVGGKGVIKPVDGHGGGGIFALNIGDPNFNVHVETVTINGRRLAMVQEFIPEVSEGDKRILLMDGEALGAILRVPQGGDLRSNIHVGGRVIEAQLSDSDRAIIETMRARLKADGLRFVGLDVIGGKLTEVNVTSPTGIQQAARFCGEDLAGKVLEAVERGSWT